MGYLEANEAKLEDLFCGLAFVLFVVPMFQRGRHEPRGMSCLQRRQREQAFKPAGGFWEDGMTEPNPLTPLQLKEREVILLHPLSKEVFELISVIREFRGLFSELLSPSRTYDDGRFAEILDLRDKLEGIENLKHGEK